MNTPGRKEFLSLSKKYNLIPVCREINTDLDTPISVYKKVVKKGPAYLLESVEGGENLARYSFIGFDPFIIFTSRGENSLVFAGGRQKKVSGSPLENLGSLISGYNVYPKPGLPRFSGGAVGYIGYNTVRFIERIEISRNDDLGLPDCNFIFAGTVLIYDHVRRTLTIVINSLPGDKPEKAYGKAEQQIENIIKALKHNIHTKVDSPGPVLDDSQLEANITRTEFIKKVLQAKEYIQSTDILQVVLSQQLRVPFRGEPFNVYRRLRTINPSPYHFYLDFDGIKVIGSSPEMLVRVEDNLVETHPIAGTRPRGANPAYDDVLALDLLKDTKERAEHLMLVDLGRNDLGKVCEEGSVRLARFMDIERFSHVMHLVSVIRGRLAPGKNCFEAFKACFPAGTVTGAPKVRAMEIISELEPNGRGIYAGAIGYFGFLGNLDMAIAIRTVVIHEGNAYIQAGAGIVAASDPEREYEETLNKAQALLKTLKTTVH